jgi:two-component system, sensor histidine kinase and response regulator
MFIGILGHDLRNPLGAMLAGTELLSLQLTDDKHARTLSRMAAAGRRMTAMIEQLLDLTRARLGGGLGFVRARKPVDIRELAQRALDELRASHRGRELTLEAATDSSTSGDPERLLQLFSNLVSNAISHGEPGGPVAVRITGGPRDIMVEIRNRGVIPADRLSTLFEPFRREPKDAARSTGLGLGLFICQQIALAHGGDIAVSSTAEAGTLVAVRLPRTADAAAQRCVEAANAMPPSTVMTEPTT